MRISIESTVVIILVAAVAACAARYALRAPSPPAALDPERMRTADAAIERAIGEGDAAGAVLCVVKRAADGRSVGDMLYLKAYGNRQVCSDADAATGRPVPDTVAMTADAVFDLASVSKCLCTTLAFMRLVEDGAVRLDDEVARHIEGFRPWEEPLDKKARRKGERGRRVPVTVRHLLTHTSGLPAGIHVPTFLARFGGEDGARPDLRDSLVTYLARDVARLSCPGEEFRYSCLNFIVLQAIIEKISGERLDRFADREIFRPLRLKNTWYNAIDDPTRPFGDDTPVVPTTLGADGRLLRGEVHDPTARIVNRGVSGNAGLFSTAEDMAVIASMLMNGGSVAFPKEGVAGVLGGYDRVRVLSRRAVETFFAVPDGYERFGRALGWDVESPYASCNGDLFTPHRTVCHTGYTGTSIIMDLDEGVAVILLTNRVHPHDDGSVNRLRTQIADIVASALE